MEFSTRILEFSAYLQFQISCLSQFPCDNDGKCDTSSMFKNTSLLILLSLESRNCLAVFPHSVREKGIPVESTEYYFNNLNTCDNMTHIIHGLTWTRTRVFTVGSLQLTV
jgi:hypothetical protein